MTISTHLLTPLLDGGIDNTHFFNGRLLTADALRDEQKAQRRHHEALGQAMGSGIVSGLNVSLYTPADNKFTVKNGIAFDKDDNPINMVEVQEGLAINKKGQPLIVPGGGISVTLTTSVEETTIKAGLFVDCASATAEVVNLPLNSAVLVMSPVSGYQGKAPMHGLTDKGTLNGCGSRYETAGVQFRLEGLNPEKFPNLSDETQDQLNTLLASDNDDPKRLAQLRNILAHLCFGTEDLARFAEDPFARDQGGTTSDFLKYGAADLLGLKICEIPLALLHITAKGIRFIDNWAVRRRVSPAPLSSIWPLPTGERRQAEGEAMFLQFQEQLQVLLQESAASTCKATECFRYLPAVGLLPGRRDDASGFRKDTFFEGVPISAKEIPLEGNQLIPLLQASYFYPPIDLDKKEGIWLYQVWENAVSDSAPPYLLFVTGHMPPKLDGRFDINHWNHLRMS